MQNQPAYLDYPPVWLAGFLAATWALGRLVPVHIDGAAGIGAALVALGIALMLAAVAQMAVAKTTVIPHRKPDAMVTGGVFRLTRNPIYLGDMLVLAGLALRWQVVALILVPVFMAVIERRFISGEEARLRAAFGAKFDAYAKRTRRWF
jgi:protein-S-isoprenylcysteine O-methyltransferase Ste14